MDKYEMRQDFRVWINKDVNIENIIMHDQYVRLPKPITVTIQNISCSGLSMLSNLDIPIGTCLFLELIVKDEVLPIIIEIIRNQEKKIKGKFEYGCRFLQLSETVKTKIRRFVFNQQIFFKKK